MCIALAFISFQQTPYGEEEEDDDNYVPPEYGDAATGEAEDQEEPDDVPDDDLRRVIVDAKRQCQSEREKLKFDRMLEDHKKRAVSRLWRWQHKTRYHTRIAAMEGRQWFIWQGVWEVTEKNEEEASKG